MRTQPTRLVLIVYALLQNFGEAVVCNANPGEYCLTSDENGNSTTTLACNWDASGEGNWYYCPENAMTDRLVCPQGYYCNETNHISPYICQPGTYCSEGVNKPTLCPVGFYCPDGISMYECSSAYPYLQICPGEGLSTPFNCSSSTLNDQDQWGNRLCFEPNKGSCVSSQADTPAGPQEENGPPPAADMPAGSQAHGPPCVQVTDYCGYVNDSYNAAMSTLTFTCSCSPANVFYGSYCTKEHPLTTSYIIGGIALGLTVLLMVPCLVCDGAWMVAGALDKRYINPVVQHIRRTVVAQKLQDADKAEAAVKKAMESEGMGGRKSSGRAPAGYSDWWKKANTLPTGGVFAHSSTPPTVTASPSSREDTKEEGENHSSASNRWQKKASVDASSLATLSAQPLQSARPRPSKPVFLHRIKGGAVVTDTVVHRRGSEGLVDTASHHKEKAKGVGEAAVDAELDNMEDGAEAYKSESTFWQLYTTYIQPCMNTCINALDLWAWSKYVVGGIVIFLGQIAADVAAMIANAFLIIKGLTAVVPDFHPERMAQIIDSFERFVEGINPNLIWIARVFEWVFGKLRNFHVHTLAVGHLSVTCEGSQAPLKLLTNVLVVVLVAVIFECHLFAFLDISISAGTRALRGWLRARRLPTALAGLAAAAARLVTFLFEYLVQLLQGLVAVHMFVPYHATTQPACGPVERWYGVLSTAVFWPLFVVSGHVLLRTFVWGKPEGAHFRTVDRHLPHWLKNLCCYNESAHTKEERFYQSQRGLRYSLEEHERDEVPSMADVLIMVCVDARHGNLGTLRAYARTMPWKVAQLLKMTFGVWDRTLIESMQVVQMARTFDDDPTDNKEYHQDMIRLTGQSHGLVWQFSPALVSVSKFMQASNYNPIFTAGEVQTEPLLVDGHLAWWAGDSRAQRATALLLKLRSLVKARLFGWVTHMLKFVCVLLLCFDPSPLWLALSSIISVPLYIVGAFEKLSEMG